MRNVLKAKAANPTKRDFPAKEAWGRPLYLQF
jgi:hypothetical protein